MLLKVQIELLFQVVWLLYRSKNNLNWRTVNLAHWKVSFFFFNEYSQKVTQSSCLLCFLVYLDKRRLETCGNSEVLGSNFSTGNWPNTNKLMWNGKTTGNNVVYWIHGPDFNYKGVLLSFSFQFYFINIYKFSKKLNHPQENTEESPCVCRFLTVKREKHAFFPLQHSFILFTWFGGIPRAGHIL